MGKQDEIFSEGNLSGLPFSFNKEVTEVFEDMIDRSVPGYKTSMKLIELYAHEHIQENTFCYDLGCSLGAATKSLLVSSQNKKVNIVSIDNSLEMIKNCKERFSKEISNGLVEFRVQDVTLAKLTNASVVVLNFVLQFLDLEKRDSLIKNIYKNLKPGGVLIISEKIHFKSESKTSNVSSIYHQFKSNNGYSDLEISSKREALKGVLMTETEKVHVERMKKAGFKDYRKLMFNLNFLTYLFIK
jgi:tRNA (cmo5U34)-methyltransferase